MGKCLLVISLVLQAWILLPVLTNPCLAKLSTSNLSGSEIQRAWISFENNKERFQVNGAYPYMACFEAAAMKYNVPLPLLIAVSRGESNFDPNARSNKDCMGIMQIQWPSTAKELGIVRKSDLFDPCINIDAGTRYLSKLLARYGGDSYLAVAAYNYGPNAVSSRNVPEGARWYAAYIHNHLLHVITENYQTGGRLLVMRFTFYKKAAEFAAYLQERVKDLPVEVFKSQEYTFDVYITYSNHEESRNYLRCLMEKTGIKPIDGGRL